MVAVYKNIIKQEDIKILLDWFLDEKEPFDDRGDVRSKKLNYNLDNSIKYVLKNIVDNVLNYPYEMETILFLESRTGTINLHVDNNDKPVESWGHNILIPLYVQGNSDTIWFDNHCFENNVRLIKSVKSNYSYRLKDMNENWIMIGDIRSFLNYNLNDTVEVQGGNYKITEDFLNLINYLIEIRGKKTISPRLSNYENITNYNPNSLFDEEIKNTYMQHIELEDLNGLAIDKIVSWEVGDIYKWERSQIHCGSSRHSKKIGISIFTNKLNATLA